jgi:xylulokinase
LFLGIDLGTSGIKIVLVDDAQKVLDQEAAPLSVERPRILWSEQDPETWWSATAHALDRLASRVDLAGVKGIGLSGQMHGATLLDASDRVLRPAILWNDGRSADACLELERRLPDVKKITGNLVMPGFTAPKLIWMQEHEREIFDRIARVLLPKDYLRLRLCGEAIGEMSDAAGTLWLDVAERRWSVDVIEACGLSQSAMPQLVEGSQPGGTLQKDLARRWGIAEGVVIAGGAGDQAAGAVGAGVVEPGRALLALGTSGVLFVAGDAFAPNPDQAVHAFCHALPDRWHQMSVTLSAASCLSWLCGLTGATSEASLLEEMERVDPSAPDLVFLPYLSGERTPHNDPLARGVFFGLSHEHERPHLTRAVLEGVAFALADGKDALVAAGAEIDRISVVGGGARSPEWGRILASVLASPLEYATDAEVGPAFGAARLARLAATGEAPEIVCTPPPVESRVEPQAGLAEPLDRRRAVHRRLYPEVRDLYRRLS